MYKVAVLASTRGTNFQSLIDAKEKGILKDNVDICCLVTNKADCGAVEKAKKANIPVHIVSGKLKTREEFDEEVMRHLDHYGVDLIVLGGYMRIISAPMIQKYKNRIINIHPSLLPKYPGMDLDVHTAVIEAGEKESGMTIHFINEGVDTGTIILQKKVEVFSDDTPSSLKEKVQALEKEWYPKVVQMFADEKIKIENDKVIISD